MANLTTPISVQIDTKDKEQVTKILQKLGVSMSGLINMTIKQVIMHGGIPFEIEIPKEEYELYKYFNEENLNKAANELEYIEKHPKEYKKYNNVNEVFEALDNDD